MPSTIVSIARTCPRSYSKSFIPRLYLRVPNRQVSILLNLSKVLLNSPHNNLMSISPRRSPIRPPQTYFKELRRLFRMLLNVDCFADRKIHIFRPVFIFLNCIMSGSQRFRNFRACAWVVGPFLTAYADIPASSFLVVRGAGTVSDQISLSRLFLMFCRLFLIILRVLSQATRENGGLKCLPSLASIEPFVGIPVEWIAQVEWCFVGRAFGWYEGFRLDHVCRWVGSLRSTSVGRLRLRGSHIGVFV